MSLPNWKEYYPLLGFLTTLNDIFTRSCGLSIVIIISSLMIILITGLIFYANRKAFNKLSKVVPGDKLDRPLLHWVQFNCIGLVFLCAIPVFCADNNQAALDDALFREKQVDKMKQDSLILFPYDFIFGDTTLQELWKKDISALQQKNLSNNSGQTMLAMQTRAGDTLLVNDCQTYYEVKGAGYQPLPMLSKVREEWLEIKCGILKLARHHRKAGQPLFQREQLFATNQWPISLLSSINPTIRRAIDQAKLQGHTFHDWIKSEQLKIQDITSNGASYVFGEEEIRFFIVMFGDFNADDREDLVMIQRNKVQNGMADHLELLVLTKVIETGKIEKIN